MPQSLDPLITDMLRWIAERPRAYDEVMEAWRTSCPQLTVWEDAVDRGFCDRAHGVGGESIVRITGDGRAFLARKTD